jgi:hypothetical protein
MTGEYWSITNDVFLYIYKKKKMKQWEKIHGCIKLEEKRERTKSRVH